MRRLAISILVLITLSLVLGSAPEIEARTLRRVVVFDSLDVSAQTADVTVEISNYYGGGKLIGGLFILDSYTFTTTAGALSFYVTETTAGHAAALSFVVDIVTDGSVESGDEITFSASDVNQTVSLGMAPATAGSYIDYYVYGQKLYALYDHNGGDTGYITLILYIADD